MRGMKRHVISVLILTAIMLSTMVNFSSAEGRDISKFYKLSVSMEGSAEMQREVCREPYFFIPVWPGIQAEIDDWTSAVFSGNDLSVSLEKRISHNYSAPTNLLYTWQFYDKNNHLEQTTTGRYAVAPKSCEGGILVVTASVPKGNNGWGVSAVSAAAVIQ